MLVLVKDKQMKKGLVTIDQDKIVLAKNKAGEIAFTQEAEEELKKVIELKRLADEILSFVEDKLFEAMEKEHLQKIVSGDIVVSKRFYGGKYEISDAEAAKDFIKEVLSVKLDTQKVEEYVEIEGTTPEGVSLKRRTQAVSISKRGESE